MFRSEAQISRWMSREYPGLSLDEIKIRVDARVDAIPRAARPVAHGVHERPRLLLVVPVQHRVEQVLLALEIIKNKRLGRARVLRHIVHAHAVEPALHKQFLGRLQELFLRLNALVVPLVHFVVPALCSHVL